MNEGLDTIYARWLSGDLTASEIDALKQSGEWSELEAITKATEHLIIPAYDKDAAFTQLVKARSTSAKIHQLPQASDKATPTFSIGKYSIAASVALLLGALFLFQMDNGNTISASYSQVKAHKLLDDSEVTLNDGSSIAYDAENWDKERNIHLKGEALFQVTKGVPFSVETQNGTVQVLGTQFNVRAWGDNLYVQCYTGKVRVSQGDQETILTRHQSVNIIDGVMGKVTVNNSDQPKWQEGNSEFQQEDITQVLLELKRQYDIQLDMPQLDQTFSGSFTHTDLNTALEQICKPMGITYHINSQENSVTISK